MSSTLEESRSGEGLSLGLGKGPSRLIFRYIRERKGLFSLNLGVRLVKELLPFLGPIFVGRAADVLTGRDRALLGFDLDAGQLRSIYIIAALMAALALAKVVLGYAHTIVSAHMGRHVVEAARRDLADASMRMAIDERRRFNSGDLLDRSLTDTKGLRSFIQNVVIRVISNTVRAIWPLTYMFMIDWVMSLVVLAVIPLQSTLSALLQRRLQRLTRDARAAEATHTSAVKESIDGWNSVASVGSQDFVAAELRETAALSEDAKIRKKHTTAAISGVISLFTSLGIAACYAIGGWRIIDSGMVGATGNVDGFTYGDLIIFIGIAKKVYAPFQAYTKIVSSYRTGLVNLERIAEVLDAPMLDDRADGPELVVTAGNVELNDVGFVYDGANEPTLKSLTGSIPGRTLTVITGQSGSGKTTLLRLLLGLDQPHHGTVSIDGQNINVAQLASVQKAMALVPQETMLFTGTLGENLLLGHTSATTEEMLDACHRAGLLELVRELPEGLETQVGSGKHLLSGGQQRRMAIARALLRNPMILLLDEPTAGLDDLHSSQVLDTLRRIAQTATVIMVSHRRDPLAASDHHLILEDGWWSDGDGNTDRWRPEFQGSVTDQAATVGEGHDEALVGAAGGGAQEGVSIDEATAAPSQSITHIVLASEPTVPEGVGPAIAGSAVSNYSSSANGDPTNGAPTNGTGGTSGVPANGSGHAIPAHAIPANGSASNGSAGGNQVSLERRALSLSAMGRPLHLDVLDHQSPSARVMIIGGHRSEAVADQAAIADIAARAGADKASRKVALGVVLNVNPDGEATADHRTVLGIDPSTDHRDMYAGETRTLQGVVNDWGAHVLIDVGTRISSARVPTDVEIEIRYPSTAEGTAPDWLAQLGGNIRRRLSNSAHTTQVALAAAEPTSLTAALDVPVIEVTSVAASAGVDRSNEALIEATLAAYQATGQLRFASLTTQT